MSNANAARTDSAIKPLRLDREKIKIHVVRSGIKTGQRVPCMASCPLTNRQ